MKKTHVIILLLALGFVQQANAQTEVADCPIHMQQRAPMKDYTLAYFNLQGMNLARYDWKNKKLNCDINGYNNAWKNEKLFKVLGYVGLGLGVTIMSMTPIVTAKKDLYYGYGESGGGSVAATIVPGIIFLGGGATSFVFGAKAKKKKNRHYQNILMEYSANPWN